jgi:hypothetical protein
MLEILKLLGLSDEASAIYINCLGRGYLTFYEIYSLFPSMPLEDFNVYISQLINKELFVKGKPSESKILIHYLALPPYQPLLNFFTQYEGILSNLDNVIKASIVSAIEHTIDEEKTIEFDSILNEFEYIKRDASEEMLIEKADVEQIIESKEIYGKVKNTFLELKERIRHRAQTQSGDIIKRQILQQIKDLDLKKNDLKLIENLFETKLEVITYNFADELFGFLKGEIEQSENSIKHLVNEMYGNIEQNMDILNSFEKKMKEIEELIRTKKDLFQNEFKNFENVILEKILSIIQKLSQGIYDFSQPIKNAIQSYLLVQLSPEKTKIDKIWQIKSMIKINEEILNLLNNSTDEIIFILPRLREHLSVELLQDLPPNLKIKVGSSEPANDPLVQNCLRIKNLEWRNIRNDNVVAIKGDNNYIIIAILQNLTDPLNDCIGFGTNFQPLINILIPIINSTWDAAR